MKAPHILFPMIKLDQLSQVRVILLILQTALSYCPLGSCDTPSVTLAASVFYSASTVYIGLKFNFEFKPFFEY
jgi:hypothetical protein